MVDAEAAVPAIRSRPGTLPRSGWLLSLAVLATFGAAGPAMAAEPAPPPAAAVLSPGRTFVEQTGESLFANICQGCHMRDAKGATGAGAYPSLAGDANLQAAGYAVHVVVGGLRAMPAFGEALTDEQVAAVVNYLRTHFDNHCPDAVTPGDVKAARP